MSERENNSPSEESSAESVNPEMNFDGNMLEEYLRKEYNFNLNEDELETVGEGSYGILYKTFDLSTGNSLALKKIKQAYGPQGVSASTMNEVSLLKELEHENVIKLHTIVMFPNKFFLLLDYMDSNLEKKLMMQQTEFGYSLPENKIKSYMRQILSALDYCHSHRVIHLDLQPKNILVDNNDMIKITNFKRSKLLTFHSYYFTRNPKTWYTAPELLLGFKIDHMSADLWSIGCIFTEMIALKVLFPGETKYDQISIIFKALGTPTEETWPDVKKVFNFDVLYPKVEARPIEDVIPELDDKDHQSVFNALCVCNPAKRVSAHKMLEMEYFGSVEQVTADPA